MAEVTADEMIALLKADIKFAKEIGDTEFANYLEDAKDKLVKEIGEKAVREYKKIRALG